MLSNLQLIAHLIKINQSNRPFPLQSANKARILERILRFIFLISQIAERVNNHTKYKICNNQNNYNVERQVEDETVHVGGRLKKIN